MPTAVEYSLAIDGIVGESQVEGHKGEIEIASFSFGVTQFSTIGSQTGGAGSGKAALQDIHFSTPVNVASPSLFKACASGQHFKKAVLTCRKAGEKPIDFLKITLTDLLVSGYSLGSHELDNGFSALPVDVNGDGIPIDQFSLNFHKVDIQFASPRVVNGDGTPVSSDLGVTGGISVG